MKNRVDPLLDNFGESYFNHTQTVAESLIEILKFFKINRIYGIGGDYAANLIKTLDQDFDLIPSSNEMHAGFSACAEAELNGIAASLVTYTVGSLPCLTAAALAKTENLPVIFISGAPSPDEALSQSVHHMVHSSSSWQKEDHSALAAFSALGIKSERLLWPCNQDQPTIANQQLFEILCYAIKKSEPVFIEIPRALLNKKCQRISLPDSLSSILNESPSLTGAPLIADEILQKLNQSNNPLLVFGERLKHNKRLIEAMLKFCKTHHIPYAFNLFAKGLVDEYEPLCLGVYNGVLSSKATRDYVEHQADYLLEICTSIWPQDTSTAFGTNTYRLNHFTSSTRLRGTSTLCNDVLEVFELLNNSQNTFKFEVSLKSEEQSEVFPQTELQFANLSQVLNQIQASRKESFVYLPEVGNSFFSSFSLKIKKAEVGRGWISNPFYAAMGTSLPYAHSVCREIQSRHLNDVPIVITGDGGFHFQLNELINFQRGRLFVIILYMKNNLFHLGKMSASKMYHSSDQDFHPQQLVKAYGGYGYKIDSFGALQRALNLVLDLKKGIHLLEIPVGTEDHQQSPEVQIINTFIQAKSGDLEAIKKWKKLV